MNTQEHTTPWTISYGKVIAANGIIVCSLPSRKSNDSANLIASAPDLLAVLSAIVADYHALQRSQGASSSLGAEFAAGEWLGSRLGGHIARAESAISKAKGEA